jgi:GNAT superfamily N-acetyltransferase
VAPAEAIGFRQADARVEAEALAELQRASAVAAFAGLFTAPFPFAETVERWRSFRGKVQVAELGGDLAGFVASDGDVLDALYVAPDRHCQGLGTALLGLAPAASQLWVLEANAGARRFYERRGWRPDGTTRTGPEGLTELRYRREPVG